MTSREPIRIDKKHQTLSDTVFTTLREAILDGTLQPGQWLRQEALAAEMGVSQITVREALNRLVGEGLCINVPYKGARVIAPSTGDLEDIYAMRGLLEGLAAEVAASRISVRDLDKMKKLLPDTIVDEDPSSVNRAREANREFHEIVIRASGRRYLIQVLKQIWDWIDPLRTYERSINSEAGLEIRKALGERDRIHHTQLIELLEAGDGDAARRLVTEFVQEAWENQLKNLDRTAQTEVSEKTEDAKP